MLDVKVSYFYQIRFFNPWQFPLSTAVWDPKWYHQNKGNGYIYRDTRGVVNGIRINALTPPKQTEGLCYGREQCITQNPNECAFLRVYMEHLRSINFDAFMLMLRHYMYKLCNTYNIAYKPEAIFIVHEKYDNPCSERVALRKWFEENGRTLPEYENII